MKMHLVLVAVLLTGRPILAAALSPQSAPVEGKKTPHEPLKPKLRVEAVMEIARQCAVANGRKPNNYYLIPTFSKSIDGKIWWNVVFSPKGDFNIPTAGMFFKVIVSDETSAATFEVERKN